MNHIAKNLKYLLSKEGISEYELAKKTGIPQQVLNRMAAGKNLNPTITTISPLAKYFNVPLQELIFEDISLVSTSLTTKVSFVHLSDLQKYGLDEAISGAKQYISVDVDTNKKFFATEMYDDSMEPKFPLGTILIFEVDKNVSNGDFCLFRTEDNTYVFRQVLYTSNKKVHIKSLNPLFEDYKVVPAPINFYILATLLESRTNFDFR